MNHARRVRPFSTMVRPLGFRRDLALQLVVPDPGRLGFRVRGETRQRRTTLNSRPMSTLPFLRVASARPDRLASLFEPTSLKPAAGHLAYFPDQKLLNQTRARVDPANRCTSAFVFFGCDFADFGATRERVARAI